MSGRATRKTSGSTGFTWLSPPPGPAGIPGTPPYTPPSQAPPASLAEPGEGEAPAHRRRVRRQPPGGRHVAVVAELAGLIGDWLKDTQNAHDELAAGSQADLDFGPHDAVHHR